MENNSATTDGTLQIFRLPAIYEAIDYGNISRFTDKLYCLKDRLILASISYRIYILNLAFTEAATFAFPQASFLIQGFRDIF